MLFGWILHFCVVMQNKMLEAGEVGPFVDHSGWWSLMFMTAVLLNFGNQGGMFVNPIYQHRVGAEFVPASMCLVVVHLVEHI